MKTILKLIGTVALVIVAIVIYGSSKHFTIQKNGAATSTVATSTLSTTSTTSYACAEDKTIMANFSYNEAGLYLSDGRSFMLPQTESASGMRYASGTIAFVGEGNNAFLIEGATTTYNQCLTAVVTSIGKDGKNFTDASKTLSFNYSAGFKLSGGEIGYTQSWNQNATTSGQQLVVVAIPKDYEPNTNFSEAKFVVGTSADPQAVSSCTTNSGGMSSSSQIIINNVPFTKIVFGDAGAGNYYDTTSYRTVHNNQCYAVEYTIHSTNLGAYSPEQKIKQFDKASVQNALENIVQSFKFI